MSLPTNGDRSRARAPIGVNSGHVMTVLGPVPPSSLGLTLMHEHLLLDGSASWRCECHSRSGRELSEAPLRMDMIGELRMNPYSNRDNVSLDSVTTAKHELLQFAHAGGKTVVDPTNMGIGRDPNRLRSISRDTGLNIIMGSGLYLERTHPDWVETASVDAIAELIVSDVGGAEVQPEIMSGIIGEIGVSKDFTEAERKSLRGAARASCLTGVPLSIHLPGWERLAHEVLDIVAEEGADLRHTILCHMNPSHDDLAYQESLAKRGVFLEYDMIGMDFYYPEQDAQCPSDEENARAVCRLLDHGFGPQILLSQDVFLKVMLSTYGGYGYAYLLNHFVPRLKRHGVDQTSIDMMLVGNPRAVFSSNESTISERSEP